MIKELHYHSTNTIKFQTPLCLEIIFFKCGKCLDVLGRIYIASEGINAQLSMPSQNFEKFKNNLDNINFLKGIRLNVAIEQDDFSFLKLKVKIRRNIVADGSERKQF